MHLGGEHRRREVRPVGVLADEQRVGDRRQDPTTRRTEAGSNGADGEVGEDDGARGRARQQAVRRAVRAGPRRVGPGRTGGASRKTQRCSASSQRPSSRTPPHGPNTIRFGQPSRPAVAVSGSTARACPRRRPRNRTFRAESPGTGAGLSARKVRGGRERQRGSAALESSLVETSTKEAGMPAVTVEDTTTLPRVPAARSGHGPPPGPLGHHRAVGLRGRGVPGPPRLRRRRPARPRPLHPHGPDGRGRVRARVSRRARAGTRTAGSRPSPTSSTAPSSTPTPTAAAARSATATPSG